MLNLTKTVMAGKMAATMVLHNPIKNENVDSNSLILNAKFKEKNLLLFCFRPHGISRLSFGCLHGELRKQLRIFFPLTLGCLSLWATPHTECKVFRTENLYT